MAQESFIKKAQEIYESIFYKNEKWFCYYLDITFQYYGIKKYEYPKVLEILDKLLGSTEARYLMFWIKDDDGFDFTFKDKPSQDIFGNICEVPQIMKDHHYWVDLNLYSKFEKDLTGTDEPQGQYAIIAALHICRKLKSQQHNNDATNFNLLHALKDQKKWNKLKKSSLRIFCAKLVSKKQKQKFKDYNIDLTLLFFSYLWKSIAVGEFYYVNRYKDIILPKKYDDSLGEDISNNKLFPDFVNYYSDISSGIAAFFNRVTKLPNTYELHFDLDLGLNVETALEKYRDSALLKLLRKLTQQLFNITVIDLRYFTSDANLSTLVNFIYGFNSLKKNLLEIVDLKMRLNNEFGFDAYSLLMNDINSLLFKACVMMDQIRVHENKQRDNKRSKDFIKYSDLSNNEIDIIINEFLKYVQKENADDSFSMYYNEHPIKTTQQKLFDCLEQCNYNQYPHYIFLYNDFARKGIESYINGLKIYELLERGEDQKIILKAIEKYVDDMRKDISTASPTLLTESIHWLFEQLEKEGNKTKNHEIITLYAKALNCLRLFIVFYGNGKDTPLRFRSYFEYSFVEIKEEKAIRSPKDVNVFMKEYDSDNLKDCIFFASYKYNPISMKYLDDFFMRYNREFRKHESEAIGQSIIESQGTVEAVKEERGRTLQLVGLLGSFIAFIAASVRAQNMFDSVQEYLLYASTFMSAIGLFVLFVYLIASFVRFTKQNLWHILAVIAPFLIFLILTIILFFCSQSGDSGVLNGEEKIKSDSSSYLRNVPKTIVIEIEESCNSSFLLPSFSFKEQLQTDEKNGQNMNN